MLSAASELLVEYAEAIRADYGVDPRIFLGLVAISVPPFYLALAIAVRAFVSARRRQVAVMTDRTFVAWAAMVGALWLLPYGYVALYGRLPWWAWAAFFVLVALGFVQMVQSVRARTATVEAPSSSSHE